MLAWWSLLLVLTSGVALGETPAPYQPSVPETASYDAQYLEPQGYGVQTGYEGFLVSQGLDEEEDDEEDEEPTLLDFVADVGERLGLIRAPEEGTGATTGSSLLGSLFRPRAAWMVLLPMLRRLVMPLFAPLGLILAGAASVAGVCIATPLCTLTVLGIGLSRESVQRVINTDRFASLTSFVQDAINKYSVKQKKVEKKARQMKKLRAKIDALVKTAENEITTSEDSGEIIDREGRITDDMTETLERQGRTTGNSTKTSDRQGNTTDNSTNTADILSRTTNNSTNTSDRQGRITDIVEINEKSNKTVGREDRITDIRNSTTSTAR